MGLKRAVTDYIKGQSTVGNCGECGHVATASPGCSCGGSWCPCHKAYYGHSAHFCDCYD